VITGAPSCGKTTVIDLLEDRGFPTVEECARRFLEREITSGRSIDEIHDHGVVLQQQMLEVKLGVEASLDPDHLLFLDTAVTGSIAWYRLFGLDPNEAARHCFRHRYASVFVLDPLPLTADGLRFEDDTFTDFLDEWIERDYIALGYTPTRVPTLAPEDRLRYILDRVPQHPSSIRRRRTPRALPEVRAETTGDRAA
jgi:predicted ATPase